MFFLGIIGLIQVCFVPGYILYRYLGLRESLIANLATTFFFSLIINYILVFALTVLGIYTRLTVFIILAVELIWIINIIRTQGFWLKTDQSGVASFLFLENHEKSLLPYIIKCLMAALYISIGLIYTHTYIYENIGTTFKQMDAVLSWNRWAVDWYNNAMPSITHLYPQLLPANWSLIYKFIGTDEIQLFAKAMMPIFALVGFLLMGQISANEKKYIGILAGIVFMLVIMFFYTIWVSDGYADIPVSMFSLAALYMLFRARKIVEEKYRDKIVLVGFALCGGALVVKQTGLFIFIAYPFLLWLYVYKGSACWNAKELKKILSGLAVALALSSPWYIYKVYQIQVGADNSILNYLVNEVHEDRDMYDRSKYSLYRLQEIVSAGVIINTGSKDLANSIHRHIHGISLLVLVVTLLSILDPVMIWVTLLLFIPSFLTWLFLFGYDVRNSIPSSPYFSLAISSGVFVAYKIIRERILKDRRLSAQRYSGSLPGTNITILVFIMLLLTSYGSFVFSPEKMRAINDIGLRNIGVSSINQMLYLYDKTVGLKGKVLTNYAPMSYLPGMDKHFLYILKFKVESFQKIMNTNGREINYILIRYSPGYASREFDAYMDAAISSGKFQIIGKGSHYLFMSIVRK